MKEVIVNADDFGMSKGVNDAIVISSKLGVLTSTSIMANMPAFEDAINKINVNNMNIGIGIHISLTEGKSVLKPSEIPLLVDSYGHFKNSFASLFIQVMKSKSILQQIEIEIKAQFEKLHSFGVKLDHVNSHHHIHMIPRIFSIVSKVATYYNYRSIRLIDESFIVRFNNNYLNYYLYPLKTGNIVKKILLSSLAKMNKNKAQNVWMPDHCFGVLHSGQMDLRALRHIFNSIQPGVTEIIIHPGLYNGPEPAESRNKKMEKWLQSSGRKVELETLLSDSIRYEIERNNIRLVRFSDIAMKNNPL
jgi:hopanoid biosynthesis associated protein HpnK